MMLNQIIILIILLFGVLIVSFILVISLFINALKEKSDNLYFFISLLGLVIIFVIPVILGLIQEL
ncbi:MAG: hypothetical protein ACFFB0_11225 [Promethearchaeota archaeon]